MTRYRETAKALRPALSLIAIDIIFKYMCAVGIDLPETISVRFKKYYYVTPRKAVLA